MLGPLFIVVCALFFGWLSDSDQLRSSTKSQYGLLRPLIGNAVTFEALLKINRVLCVLSCAFLMIMAVLALVATLR